MRKVRPPLERREDAYIRKLYRTAGCVVITFSQPRRTKQTPGIPDMRIYDPRTGTAWWHEVKRQQGEGFLKVASRQSPAQKEFQALVEAHGEEYLIGARDVARGRSSTRSDGSCDRVRLHSQDKG